MAYIEDIKWHSAGHRDWELSMVVAAYGDREPENVAAREKLADLRASIPTLNEAQLRGYLNGLLDEVESNFGEEG